MYEVTKSPKKLIVNQLLFHKGRYILLLLNKIKRTIAIHFILQWKSVLLKHLHIMQRGRLWRKLVSYELNLLRRTLNMNN
jgi:hypothetical protein